VQHERKLTALAALREFFSVFARFGYAPPQVLRAAPCVLGALTISRSWNKRLSLRTKNLTGSIVSKTSIKQYKRRVDQKIRDQTSAAALNVSDNAPGLRRRQKTRSGRTRVNRVQPKDSSARRIEQTEREQLAADLRLIPKDDEELPLYCRRT